MITKIKAILELISNLQKFDCFRFCLNRLLDENGISKYLLEQEDIKLYWKKE